MIWFAAIFFALAGILMVIRRQEIARGQSMMWGGTTMPGCVVVQGVLLVLAGALFLVAREMGWIGG
ncbi:MAG TPA: hypothetical protein VNA88_05085 [Candidatus Kapabacteria bacterium]|jgi:drug/metabolite transporter (DMT)-like permease|nr:hypothetical protein [Candidatus Kapabacteria bacterium]